MSSTRWLVGTVVGVVVLAVVAVIATGLREPASLPPGSPEATVQRYLQAVADGDRDALQDTYAPEMRRRCEQQPGRHPPFPEERTSFDADLLGTRDLDDGSVEVRVRITEFSGEPPFGDGGYDHTEVFRLERVAGTWGIVEAFWPYYDCVG